MISQTLDNVPCLILLYFLLLLVQSTIVSSSQEMPTSAESVLPRDWPVMPVAAAFMALFWLMVRCGVPAANVSGFMMMVFSFLWWNLRVDPRTAPTVLWT